MAQRPRAHEQSSGSALIREGRQRRTHSSALGSRRSAAPPGQHRVRSIDASLSVSGSVRSAISMTIAPTVGSRADSSIAVEYPFDRSHNRLELCASAVYALWGTFAIASV
jgi:hypothetical protein